VRIKKIVSGGQTGADRAALDWTIAQNIPHGGWCPAGRRAEDGVIPDCYDLQETDSKGYMKRTKCNIRDSDATLIISLCSELTGGSLFTHEYATRIGKPSLHVYPDCQWQKQIKTFLETNRIQILNVAGPRISNEPGVKEIVFEVLNYAGVIETQRNQALLASIHQVPDQ